ncbi:putative 2OG-Fe(II) oxygenase [Anatilimnocola floriformis]|uniref:putative 2OG-Fe(II) oxygenase n=1 Tax=Anatilimnocola floriformis TaxID=2948575 RepID=UPI0020C37C11|nr:putative 2OG-Fe(II) oxygenase [Anatilimnocola floriformis]
MPRFESLQLTAVNDERVDAEPVAFAAGTTVHWPRGTAVTTRDDLRIFGVNFADGNLVHPEFAAILLQQAARQPQGMLGFGGKKIRDPGIWDLPAARLLTRRALLFFCKAYNQTSAHTTDQWANVMDPGDYSYPHCHYDSQASLVYYLDPGEADPKEKLAGRFHFSDPRIPYCCSTHPERPTRGLLPDIRTGTLLMFPSEFVHFVHPYRGQRPRITLAWNISPGPPPAVPEEANQASNIARGTFRT